MIVTVKPLRLERPFGELRITEWWIVGKQRTTQPETAARRPLRAGVPEQGQVILSYTAVRLADGGRLFPYYMGKRRRTDTMNALKTGLLMAALFGLFMLVGRLLGGATGLILGFAFALATNFFAYWFSDKMALKMSGAKEVSQREAPQLYRMVGRLTINAGLPMPRLYVIPSPQPNAFATGRDPHHAAVAVTEGILQALSEEELEGVLAHELAHVKNRDILISSVAAVFVGTLSFLAQFAFMFGGSSRDDDREGTNPLVAIFAAIISYVAAVMIQLAISRAREYEADRVGAQMCGRPLSLANALLRIEKSAERMPVAVNPATSHMYIINPLGGDKLKSLAALFRTHPLTEDRVARLEAMARDMGHSSRRSE